MNASASDLRQWLVSVRTRGELLAASVRMSGAEAVFLAPGSDDRVEEAQGWLRDLIGMASETAQGEADPHAIPLLLHHLLTGLLFSHVELWSRPDAPAPYSMAFVRAGREVAFGWVGEVVPDLWIDDRRAEVEWVRVRDHNGREARALAIADAHRVRVHVALQFAAAAGVHQGTIDGAWVPEPAAATGDEPSRASSPVARAPQPVVVPAEPDAAPAVGASPAAVATFATEAGASRADEPRPAPAAPTWQVVYEAGPTTAAPAVVTPVRADEDREPRRAWWANVLGLLGGGRRRRRVVSAPLEEAQPEARVTVLEMGEIESGTDAAESGAESPPASALAVPEPAELAAPSSATEALLPGDVEPEPQPRGVSARTATPADTPLPEMIPPTPEPPSLTERAAATSDPPGADALLAALAAASTAGLERGAVGAQAEPVAPTFESRAPVRRGSAAAEPLGPHASELRIESAALEEESFFAVGPARLSEPALSPAEFGASDREPAAPLETAHTGGMAPVPVAPLVAPAPPRPAPPPGAATPAVPPVVTAPNPIASAPAAPAPPEHRVAPVPPPPASTPPPNAPAPAWSSIELASEPSAPVASPFESAPPMIAPAPAAGMAATALPTTAAAPTPAVPPPTATVPPPAPADAEAPTTGSAVEGDPPFLQVDAPPSEPRARVPMRPQWPEPENEVQIPAWWLRPWVWGAFVVALFAGGWFLGGLQPDREVGNGGAFSRAVRALGLGGARFDVALASRPAGAWIAVNGKDLGRRTPASIDLPAGAHQIDLSFSDLGSARFEVRGARGDRVALDEPLWGSLTVYGSDSGIPVNVEVDGTAYGLAPVTVDSLSPGAHDVRFSGPGLMPWGQTVQVHVKEDAKLVARPVTSPATGLLQVRARWTDTEGSEDLNDAAVYVDGDKRGETPLTLELPRGPHSVRVESRGESSPVQVIDLPGGNQRFATFDLGLGVDRPHMEVIGGPVRVSLSQPTVISAVLSGASPGEIREMWLHVRQPDGAWRRYPMEMMRSPTGIVGTAVFPNTLLDSRGQTPYYCSATSQTGDDSYTELLNATEVPAAKR